MTIDWVSGRGDSCLLMACLECRLLSSCSVEVSNEGESPHEFDIKLTTLIEKKEEKKEKEKKEKIRSNERTKNNTILPPTGFIIDNEWIMMALISLVRTLILSST